MTVVTRFAPSPTGFLHIGGARTALFNWLFAKHHGGKFLLRIEDTDKKRSTEENVQVILDSMGWLGLDWDGEEFYQSKNELRHKEIAEQLLENGNAYKCYCTAEELQEMRDKGEGYDGRWRERDPSEAPEGVDPTIRLKTQLEGETIIDDIVQGKVTFQNEEIDDLVILRSDGTPTYMLAVVVDDYDMGVTHVIRGDDHLNNSAKQQMIYEALGWDVPKFAHVPLIHGPDGAKFSKRHGAPGVGEYKDMGYLPEAMRNYLLRLGWSHGDDEIISTEQAIEWFDLDHVGKSPARFDFDKLNHINAHYLKEADVDRLIELITPLLEKTSDEGLERIKKGMDGLKEKAKTINELAEQSAFYIERLPFSDKAKEVISSATELLGRIVPELEELENWDEESIKDLVKNFAEKEGVKMGQIGQPMRAALVGDMAGPGIFEIITILGKNETLARLKSL